MSLNHKPTAYTIRKLSHHGVYGVAIVSVMCAILACINPEPALNAEDMTDMDDVALDASPDGAMDPSRVRLTTCLGASTLPDRALEPWRGLTSRLTARGQPSHALHDVITTRNRAVDFLGHVTYGLFERELEGEFVDLYIHDCDEGFSWLARGVTRRDGMVRFVIEEQDVPFHGEYELLMRVVGDGTTAHATLRVLPAQTRLVVLDIDDVLSADRLSGFQDRVAEFFEPVGLGDYVPEPRAGAAQMTQLRASQGYEMLYLTPRPHELTQATRDWLRDQGFAAGTLWFADEPNTSLSWNVTPYKRGVLERMIARGYVIDAAYGATPQDIDAYLEAGVDRSGIFSVGDAMPAGAASLGQGYLMHNDGLGEDVLVAQPFER